MAGFKIRISRLLCTGNGCIFFMAQIIFLSYVVYYRNMRIKVFINIIIIGRVILFTSNLGCLFDTAALSCRQTFVSKTIY